MNTKRVALWILLFSACLTAPAHSDDPGGITVKAEVNHAFITIGDEIELKLIVSHEPDITVTLPRAEEALGDFEVKRVTDFSYREAVVRDGREAVVRDGRETSAVVEGKIYTITSYALGEYVVKPIAVVYQSKNGGRSLLETPKLYITVESVDKTKDPKTDIKGAKGVLAVEDPPWIWVFSAVMLMAATGVVLWRYARQRRAGEEAGQTILILSAYEEATQALNQLAHSDWLQKAQYKLYFLRMSEILRRYFERRFQVNALELTTREVIANLKNKLPPDQLQLTHDILSFCDLVKFAKLTPSPPEILKQNQIVKLVIDQTREALSEMAPASSRPPPVIP